MIKFASLNYYFLINKFWTLNRYPYRLLNCVFSSALKELSLQGWCFDVECGRGCK